MSRKGSEDKLDAALAALDNWYEDALKSGMGFKTEDERQAYLATLGDPEKHPMFATSTEDLEGNPLAQALWSIREEDQTKYELAIMYKDEGNEWMKKTDKKSLNEAYDRYTHALTFIPQAIEESKQESIKQSVEDIMILKSQILSNRAQTNLLLQNYGSCKRDCYASLSCWPENMKAHYRLCKALYILKQYELCIHACLVALKIDNNHKEILDFHQKSLDIVTKQQQATGMALNSQWKTISSQWQIAWELAIELQVSLTFTGSTSNEPLQLQSAWPSSIVDIDSQVKKIYWPMLLLYPQYNKFDIIPDADIDCMLAEYLIQVFPEPEEDEGNRSAGVEWDLHHEYRASNLVVYLTIDPLYQEARQQQVITSYPLWQLACLEHASKIQSLSLEFINYALNRIQQLEDPNAPNNSSSSSSSANASANASASGTATTSTSILITNIPGYTPPRQVESMEQFTLSQQQRERMFASQVQQYESLAAKSTQSTLAAYEIHVGCTIRRILAFSNHTTYLLPRGILSLVFFPRASKAHKKFLQFMQAEYRRIESLNP
jgi:hypothetical protein